MSNHILYIISNPGIIGQYKVGIHNGSLNKLYSRYSTYIHNVRINYIFRYCDSVLIEEMILKNFDEYRIPKAHSYNPSEWLSCSLDEIVKYIYIILIKTPNIKKLSYFTDKETLTINVNAIKYKTIITNNDDNDDTDDEDDEDMIYSIEKIIKINKEMLLLELKNTINKNIYKRFIDIILEFPEIKKEALIYFCDMQTINISMFNPLLSLYDNNELNDYLLNSDDNNILFNNNEILKCIIPYIDINKCIPFKTKSIPLNTKSDYVLLTPLLFSILKNNMDAVNILLENGADPNELDTKLNTILHIIIIYYRKIKIENIINIIELLNNYNINKNKKNINNHSIYDVIKIIKNNNEHNKEIMSTLIYIENMICN